MKIELFSGKLSCQFFSVKEISKSALLLNKYFNKYIQSTSNGKMFRAKVDGRDI